MGYGSSIGCRIKGIRIGVGKRGALNEINKLGDSVIIIHHLVTFIKQST